MRKTAYVVNIIKKSKHSYLDVVLEDGALCGNISNLGEARCSSCVGSCTMCDNNKARFARNIRVWNKSDKKFERGDKIYLEIRCKNYFLQMFFALILPIILFIATFFLLEASHSSEALSIFLSFLVFAGYSSLFSICSRYMFYRFFLPFV